MARTPNIEIAETIRRRILSGEFDAMSLLPSERILSEQLSTGRGVVRNALKALQQEGLVQLIPGRGASLCRSALKPRFERFIVCFPDHPHLSSRAYETLGLLSGICVAAAANYSEAVVSFSHAENLAQNLISRYRSGDIQGVLFIESPGSPEIISELLHAGVPCVVANEENGMPWTSSRMDFRMIGRTAGFRLATAGHRTFGAISGPLRHFMFKEILAGFRGALAEEELAVSPAHVLEFSYKDEDYARLLDLLKSPDRPNAFFVIRDHRAQFFYQACDELGLKIPDDISIISYDNITWPEGQSRGLTTIEQPVNDIGLQAVTLLEKWYLAGRPPESVALPCRLLERHSVKNI